MSRIDLTVNVRHEIGGRAIPTSIVWEDGRVFAIDKVYDIRKAASLKAGGIGIRYTCKICAKTVIIFNDDGLWFMEKYVITSYSIHYTKLYDKGIASFMSYNILRWDNQVFFYP